jgi:hypothetical protein
MYPPGSAPYLSAVNVTAHVLEMKRRIDQFIPVVPAHRAVCLDEGLAVRSRFLWTPTLGPVFLIELLVSEVEVEWVEMGSSCNLCEVDGI